jgi:hypothetical protein
MRNRMAALPCVWLLLWSLATPPAWGQSGQQAGKISVVMPVVDVERGSQRMAAEARMPVLWGDIINTGRLARARVALDDGSILNVASESILQIVQHDVPNQQTQLDLTYGRIRAKAVKLTKPGAKFEVRTPTGTAGVVGTDFFISYENFVTRLIVYEGTVKFCSRTAACVDLAAGLTSVIATTGAPSPPQAASPSELTDSGSSTAVQAKPPGASAAGFAVQHPILFKTVALMTMFGALAVVRTVSTDCGCSHGIVVAGPNAAAPGHPRH